MPVNSTDLLDRVMEKLSAQLRGMVRTHTPAQLRAFAAGFDWGPGAIPADQQYYAWLKRLVKDDGAEEKAVMNPEQKTSPRKLGRGLGALLGEAAGGPAEPAEPRTLPTPTLVTAAPRPEPAQTADTAPVSAADSTRVAIDKLVPGPFQPRRIFNDEALAELAQSIREKGVLQPILVRPLPGAPGQYQIIGGERRWRAAQLAGLADMPVNVREFTDAQAMEAAIIENVQRQDLTPLEEAEGFNRLLVEFSHTHDDLSRTLGKSRTYISNAVRLLKLPKRAREALDRGEISAGHARVLLTVDDPQALLLRILAEHLSVRATEDLGRTDAPVAQRRPRTRQAGLKNPNLLALEKELVQLTGLKATLNGVGQSGSVTLKYQTLDQLDGLLVLLRENSSKNSP